MSFERQVSRALDDEHRIALDLMGRIEQAVARGARLDPEERARLARAFAQHLEHDVGRHFDFEERELFTRLAEAGDIGVGELLSDEHAAIRDLAAELLPLAQAAAQEHIDADGWDRFGRLSFELVERQVSHIQKETMALLPMLDDLLDDETDRELALAYAST